MIFLIVLCASVCSQAASYYHLGPAYYCKSIFGPFSDTDCVSVCESTMERLKELLGNEKWKKSDHLGTVVSQVCATSGWVQPIKEAVSQIPFEF